jgi:hypothetical protein
MLFAISHEWLQLLGCLDCDSLGCLWGTVGEQNLCHIPVRGSQSQRVISGFR